jgi:hypothetical protein
MRLLLGVVLLSAVLMAGCGLPSTPYNGQQACDIVGGIYTADGRCQAGNS